MRTFKLTIRLESVTYAHLPRLIKAVQKGGRALHADAMLIFGDKPPPEILLYGEDLVPDTKERAGGHPPAPSSIQHKERLR